METYSLSQLSEETLKALVTLRVQVGVSDEWENMQKKELTPAESTQIDYLKSILRERDLVVMNEATLWARAIYPILVLAEQTYVQAWAGIPLKATYPVFQLEGEADGALAPAAAGKPQQPYLIVHEAKRGVHASDPQIQLYGEMLAAAWLNWKGEANLQPANTASVDSQEIFGCYTVSESWTFVHGTVDGIETEKPTFTVEFSRVYNGLFEVECIVQILKAIVAKQLEYHSGNCETINDTVGKV
ncbi:hypothetical protein C6501_14640 [Candidatus Poribacteria bacterium]|nr:MAG: hypothetical protein C6501_14640 [Candidatus Poribacteria bacterium]